MVTADHEAGGFAETDLTPKIKSEFPSRKNLSEVLGFLGENWQSVKLSISNAVPLRGASLPDPQTWFINHPYEEALFNERDICIRFFIKHPKNSFPWGL